MSAVDATQIRPAAGAGIRKKGTLAELRAAGLTTPPTRSIADLPPPSPPIPGQRPLSEEVIEARNDERY